MFMRYSPIILREHLTLMELHRWVDIHILSMMILNYTSLFQFITSCNMWSIQTVRHCGSAQPSSGLLGVCGSTKGSLVLTNRRVSIGVQWPKIREAAEHSTMHRATWELCGSWGKKKIAVISVLKLEVMEPGDCKWKYLVVSGDKNWGSEGGQDRKCHVADSRC